MATVVVRKIDVVPTALTVAVVAAVIGFLYGLFLALGLGGIGMMGEMSNLMGVAGMGALMIIVMPVTSFILTFIYVAVAAIVYNFVAERVGGIRFES